MTYCERHEISYCADCEPDGRLRRAGERPSGAPGDWSRWPAGTIIVHRSRKAHLPGCQHLNDQDVREPVYGWVTDPPAGAWRRISPAGPLRAVEGNTGLSAVSRCQDCDATQ
ncbi:hypothetical protein HUT13_00360 [Streptomyces harbinensis]|uniref:hypothetical protein n=1 Tax=Streptomyces TaxID=1883 RepID=UPI0002FD228F|nr:MULTISPECIES: hypothetical protein [Streptomyces]QKV67391.1 hypothetical protein HUT13_00360 [Streptomyces harbinensis]